MPGDNKTEKPTAKRRNDERKKGNVLLCQDINLFVSIAGCYVLLGHVIPVIYKVIIHTMSQWIGYVGKIEDIQGLYKYNIENQFIYSLVITCLPMLLAVMLLSIVSTGVQTRWLVSREKIKPKLSNINPISGIQKMFSLKNVVELIKNLIKITLLIILVVMVLKSEMSTLPRTMDMDIKLSMIYMFDLIKILMKRVLIAFLAIAFLDFLYQRWDFEKNLMMSKQEIKEEFKEMEGNPEIKGKIRSIQRERARNRMMQAVPTADIIIRNPTHYAVALKYDMDNDRAPIVVAKGADEIALRIVAIGEENGVFVIENKPLARGLYASVQLNQEIPEEYYGMVAEVLVYLYRLRNQDLSQLGQ